MKIKSKLLVISALVGITAIPAVCSATPARPGGYMSFYVGASAPQDSDATISEFNPVSVRSVRVEYDPGITSGGTGGYDFGYLRLEGEMSYKRGEINSVNDQTSGERYVNADGDVQLFATMANAFFDVHNGSPITPYLGGGLGYARVKLSNTRAVSSSTGDVNDHVLRSGEEGAFAYQVGAGLEAELSRRVSLDIGYRYFGTSRITFDNNWPNTTGLKLESHNATVGVRIKF